MPQQPLAQVPTDAQWFWQDHGACRDYDSTLFFHPQNERGSARMKRDRAAKLVCASCTVRLECADYAVRARGGGASAILEECRRWATAKKIG